MGEVDPEYAEFLAFKASKAQAEEAAKPPTFYVHTADGKVHVLSQEDSEASHVEGVQVIARYQVGN